MTKCNSKLTLCMSLWFCCVANTVANYIMADQYVLWDTKLTNFSFWALPVSDIGVCAKNCARVTKCKSFNFGLATKTCELNDNPTWKEQPLTDAYGVLYSNISHWPRELDPDCFDRPCGELEVCIPRGIINETQTCMPFRRSEAATPAKCLKNKYSFEEKLNMCVRVYKRTKGFSKARSICQSAGGDLIMPKTTEQQNALKNYFRKEVRRGEKRYWIGLQTSSEHSKSEEVEGSNTRCAEIFLDDSGGMELMYSSCSKENGFVCGIYI